MLRFPYEKVDVPFVKDHEILRGNKHPLMDSSNGFGIGSGFLSSGPEPSPQEKDKRIKVLQEMGASRSQAEALLKRFGWNPDIAGAVFFEANQR